MSNNIYDILKKIESLEAPKKTLTESKSMNTVKELHNESKKEKQINKGSIAEAVAQVEQQLNEKYMGFKKKMGEELDPKYKTPNIDAHDQTMRDPVTAKGSREMDAAIRGPGAFYGAYTRDERGQKAYKDRTSGGIINKVKDFVGYDKPDPAYGPKTNEGAVEESGLQAYLGKKKYGETGMKALQKAGRDGASKEKMAKIRARHDKMDESVGQEGPADLLAAVEQEINNPGRSIDNLIDVLNATFGSDRSPEFKKARAVIGKYIDLVDNAAMGSEEDGIAPMRGGNIARHIQQYDLTDYLQHAAAMLDKSVQGPLDEGSYNEEMLSPKQKSFAALAEPKDKITYADKIAGAKKGKKDEGNEFSGELVKARAQGKDSFEVDGKSYPVKEGELSAKEKWMNPDNTFKNPKTDAEWARIHKSRRDYEADLAKDGIKPPPFHLKSDDDAALRKARSQDQTDRDADRGTLNRLGNYGSRLFFGRDIPVNEGGKSMREGWEEMQKYLEKKKGPQSKGGEGKKAGTRYGGSAQKDDDEDTDGEGKPVEKKKGRPKGTGGGAKFSFKKPKD